MSGDESFGRMLRRLRKARDLTQEALAQQVYCAADTIKKLEQGLRRPSRQLAAQLADGLGLTGDERATFLVAARAIAQDEGDTTVGTAASVGAAPAAPRQQNNLPHQPTPFVGRTADLAALAALFAKPATRLVTITGPGGMGKTRLALALTEQLIAVNCFPDGVYFVALAALDTAERIVPALAEVLDFPLDIGVKQARSPRQQVFDYLSTKRLLLVFDNLEHLLSESAGNPGDAAELVAALLATAPGVVILATARERMKLREEHVYLLHGLDVVDDRGAEFSSAVALFVQRAQRLRLAFAPTRDELGVVAQICRLVDGMPLAIELAAGWVDTLALPNIAAELAHSLDLLATELHDVPFRQRSVRAVFDASWQRIRPAEQQVFARLAIFRGGGTRKAVQVVTGATLPQLQALISTALLHYDVTHDRYTIHELLRQYAAEHLANDPANAQAAHDQHATYFCGLLRDLRADLQGAHQLEALEAIEVDGENMHAAWEWAAGQRNAALIDQALESLGYFYEWRGLAEEGVGAYSLAADSLAAVSTSHAHQVRAKLLAWQSRCAYLLGDNTAAGVLLAQSQELLDDPDLAEVDTRATRAFMLLQAGQLAADHDYPAACAAYEQSQALFEALGDRRGAAAALFGLGAATEDLIGHYDRAQRYLQESLAIRRTLDDRLGMIETLAYMSENVRYRGQVEEGERLARESYQVSTMLGNRRAIALAASYLGSALYWNEQYAESHHMLQEAAAIYTDLGDRAGLANAYFRLGVAEAFLGRYADARTTFTNELQIARELGMPLEVGTSLIGLMFVALAQQTYDEARVLLTEAVPLFTGAGEHFFLSQMYAFGALAERGAGRRRQARGHALAALRTALEIRSWLMVLHAFWAIALLLADDAEPERAAELYALTERENPQRNNPWAIAVYRRELAEIATMLPAAVAAAAQARGQALDLWTTAQELLAELEAAGWGTDQLET
jgi:predicted ATPase/transcriptional regulator with XRE-family HTH domain